MSKRALASVGIAVIVGLLVIALPGVVHSAAWCHTGRLPDKRCTRGAWLRVSASDVCVPGYSRGVPGLPASRKRLVYSRYGIRNAGQYAIDRLVPIGLGGSNELRNLWPQRTVPWPGVHEKDRLESRLDQLVCAHRMALHKAQSVIAGNWVGAFNAYVAGRTGRTLVRLAPWQVAGGLAGYLWSAPSGEKQMPPFVRNRYLRLLAVGSTIAHQFGLTVKSGYRPNSLHSMHGVGLAFDMFGSVANLKRAARWAGSNPVLFQEVFVHNTGSGIHLHLAFYPDAAHIFTGR